MVKHTFLALLLGGSALSCKSADPGGDQFGGENDSGQTGGTAGGNCGNGVRDADEACEGTDFDGATCATLGFGSGTLQCTDTCDIDMMMCTGGGSAGTSG